MTLPQDQNIVFIGMPGSGKSTVGRALAALLSREFLDLDDWVTARAGKSISAIFAEEGEPAFRALESDAVRTAAELRGRVIATGGGCVLRQENMRLLGEHGLLIFLDRTPDLLMPSGSRPLADTRAKLDRLYTERLPLYRRAAGLTVDYYAPAELPSPPARVAEHIAALLGGFRETEGEAVPCE